MPLCPGAGNPIAGASPRSRARRLGGGRAVRAGRAGRRADVRRARVRDRGRRRRLSRRRRVPRQRRAPASLRSVSAQRRPTGRGADRAQGRRLRRSHPVDGRRRQLGRRSQADVPTSRMRRDRGEPGLLRGRADPVALVAGATDRRAAAAPAAAAATTTTTAAATATATAAAAARPASHAVRRSRSGAGPGPCARADRARPYLRRWPRRAFFARAGARRRAADDATRGQRHRLLARSVRRWCSGMRARQRVRRVCDSDGRCTPRARHRRRCSGEPGGPVLAGGRAPRRHLGFRRPTISRRRASTASSCCRPGRSR